MSMLDAGKHLESRISDIEQKILGAIDDVKPSTSAEFEQIRNQIEKIEKSFSKIKEQQTRVEHSVKEQHQGVQEMFKFSSLEKQCRANKENCRDKGEGRTGGKPDSAQYPGVKI